MGRICTLLLVQVALAACSFGLGTPVWAAEPAGTVTHASGSLSVRKGDGMVKALAVNATVEENDLIITDKRTYARIKFRDNSEVVLKPNSQFKVDQFAFKKEQPAEDKAVYNLVKGGLRMVTGQIGKRGDPNSYKMKTPTATIGVRGTIFDVDYISPEPEILSRPRVYLIARPEKIAKGEKTTLAWSSLDAVSCDMQPGIGAVKTEGSIYVKPEDSTIYTIVCLGEGGSDKAMASAVASAVVSMAVARAEPPAAVVAEPVVAPSRFCNKPAILKVHFATGRVDFTPTDELKTLGEFLTKFPRAHGEISGHTDNVAGRAYNQKLSEGRANSIKAYLVNSFAIAPERITTRGFNFSKPIATNKTREGRAKNRRIEANFTCE